MIQQTIFVCERCRTQYDSAGEAYACEQEHPDENELKVVGFYFRNLDRLHGPARREARLVPASIMLRFGGGTGEIASYKLDHVGLKGV